MRQSDNEPASIDNIAARYPVFQRLGKKRLEAPANACCNHLAARGGFEQVPDRAREALPVKPYDTRLTLLLLWKLLPAILLSNRKIAVSADDA